MNYISEFNTDFNDFNLFLFKFEVVFAFRLYLNLKFIWKINFAEAM